MAEPALTLEAKSAIQAYILKFVIPSGAALAIISGLFGYVLSGIARIDASAEAAKAALFAAQSASKAEASAGLASAQALKASDEASTSLERAKKSALSAEDTIKTLLASRDQMSAILTGQYGGLAKSLFEVPGFREAIATIPQRELADFGLRIKGIESTIYGVTEPAVPSENGNCPDGTYVSSIQAVSAPGGRAGFVESISILCKSIRFTK